MNKREYTLVVGKQRIQISEEIYKEYYHCRDREKYLDRLARTKNISLDVCIEDGISLEYTIASMEDTIVDGIIQRETLAQLRLALSELSSTESELIEDLFFRGKSERQLSAETGIPQRTINYRKQNVLLKLKNILIAK